MGIGDIGVSLWGECEAQDGMHLGARGFVHPELIDPETGAARRAWRTARRGELVLTHLRHRAAPLLRFRTRDHVVVRTSPCPCGRTGPRVRCIGRTDDMLIVRGVNVFPSAVREVVSAFAPDVSGHILVRPIAPGVKQDPPLPVSVELAPGRDGRSRARGRDPRETARDARGPGPRRPRPVGQLATQRVQVETRRALDRGVADAQAPEPGRPPHHDRRRRPQTSIGFWEGVLGMPFVFEQPNLDNEAESHLYFDPGDGRLITVFTNEDRVPDPDRTPTDPGCVHHLAFAVSQATFFQAVGRLDERGIRHSGVKDRGFMDSIYFEDPLGLLIELASYRFEPPHGFTHAEVLLEAHRLRVERGDYNIDREHLADAIEDMTRRSRESLSDDRAPADPYHHQQTAS